MAVMALSLFVNNLGQLKLREALKTKQLRLPSQNGNKTQRPTLKWAFQTMRNVIKVRVSIFGRMYEEFKVTFRSRTSNPPLNFCARSTKIERRI
ncbi:MAG: hypothetical protein IPJ71_18345 [Bdellovibrionales bacterium]|nr:hypothetical protein [Bdellovibrionales bacterium]